MWELRHSVTMTYAPSMTRVNSLAVPLPRRQSAPIPRQAELPSAFSSSHAQTAASTSPFRSRLSSASEASAAAHVVMVSSASGGIGCSTLAALLALSMARKKRKCALVDPDPEVGSIDVSLGLEADSGIRWSGVQAPMGKLEGRSLSQELVHWEGIDVLASDPWSGAFPQDWEVHAALSSLCEWEDCVVIDHSDHAQVPSDYDSFISPVGIDDYAAPAHLTHVVLVPLSVLGVARGKAWITKVKRAAQSSRIPPSCFDYFVLAVPAACVCMRNKRILSVEEAAAYLETEIVDYLAPNARLEKSLVSGLGIPDIPKPYVQLLERLLGRADAGER